MELIWTHFTKLFKLNLTLNVVETCDMFCCISKIQVPNTCRALQYLIECIQAEGIYVKQIPGLYQPRCSGFYCEDKAVPLPLTSQIKPNSTLQRWLITVTVVQCKRRSWSLWDFCLKVNDVNVLLRLQTEDFKVGSSLQNTTAAWSHWPIPRRVQLSVVNSVAAVSRIIKTTRSEKTISVIWTIC